MKYIFRRYKEKIMHFSYLIILFGLLFFAAYLLAPLHEIFHALPCNALGLNPEIHRFSVNCKGIENFSFFANFLYTMGPYIFNNIMLVILFFLSSKIRIMKYLMLIFPFDVIFNYISSVNQSDFKIFFYNVKLDFFYISLSIALIVFTFTFTVFAILKTKCLEYETIKSDFSYFTQRFTNKFKKLKEKLKS